MDTITIGTHQGIPVVPQKHARLRRRLSSEDFQSIMSKDYAANAYRILGILIPQLPLTVPLWEWEGYASQEAMENDVYDEETDNSPDTAQIVNAFETALMVSGAGRLGKIIGLVESAGTLTAATQTPTPTVPSPGLPTSIGE